MTPNAALRGKLACGESRSKAWFGVCRPRRKGTEMNDDQIATLTLDALGKLMNQLPTKREKSDALGVLMIAGYNLLRTTEGDEFVRGWLESALEDMARNPPACEFRMAH